MCHVAKAATFEEAQKLLETEYFDIAILDIMGVDGYKLLDIAKKKGRHPRHADGPCPEHREHHQVL
jgi:DNA-binding response OmpR family regulator